MNPMGVELLHRISLERILMLTFLTIALAALFIHEPEVHHHYYDALGEGQAHHQYGESVTSKSLPGQKKDTPGLRKPMPDYGASTSSPTSHGTSAYGSSTYAPGEGSESESEDESTSVPEGDGSESGDGSTSPPNESSASASASASESSD